MNRKRTTHNQKQNFNWILTGLALGGLLSVASMSLRGAETWTEKTPMPAARSLLSASTVSPLFGAQGTKTETSWVSPSITTLPDILEV